MFAAAKATLFGGDTGWVYAWSREQGFSEVPGTRAAGPNGIELSADGEKIFLNATLASEVRRIDRRTGAIEARAEVPQPDNSDLDAATAGCSWPRCAARCASCSRATASSADPVRCRSRSSRSTRTRWQTETVYEGGPGTPSGAGTVGLEVDGALLIGTFAGDRIVRVETRERQVAIRAVIFDLGGVVLGSPLHAIADYEREHGIAAGSVNRVVADTGADGAWGRLERGLFGLAAFAPAFEAECAAAGFAIDARVLMRAHGRRFAAAAGDARGDPGAARARPARGRAHQQLALARTATTARARCAATSTRSSSRACSGSRSPIRASTSTRARRSRSRPRRRSSSTTSGATSRPRARSG